METIHIIKECQVIQKGKFVDGYIYVIGDSDELMVRTAHGFGIKYSKHLVLKQLYDA